MVEPSRLVFERDTRCVDYPSVQFDSRAWSGGHGEMFLVSSRLTSPDSTFVLFLFRGKGSLFDDEAVLLDLSPLVGPNWHPHRGWAGYCEARVGVIWEQCL